MSQVDFLTTVGEAARSGGEAVSAERLLLVAGCKILGLAFSLGFGLVGGHILPVGFIGACIGLAVSSPFIPLSLAVPTFIASSAVSVLPVPFTVVVATASAIVLNPNQIGSVVIAVLVAQAFVNGLGLINKVFDPNGLINDDGSSAIAVDDEQIITFEQDQEDARVEDENAAEVDEEIETSQMEP
jgi:H+/Cl- antiporter ClcA